MKIDHKGNTVCLQDTKNELVMFLMKVTHEYKTFENFNIIIDIQSHKSLSTKEMNSFKPLSKIHKKAKKSFVIVASDFDFNAVHPKLSVVRSLQEAHDIIEMEEIERDLGF